MTISTPMDSAAMTAAEFRCATEALGLDQRAAAEALGVTERTVRRWIAGTQAVPAGAVADLRRIEDRTARFVAEAVSALRCDEPDEGGARWVLTYGSDATYRRHHPDGDMPAAWHRTAMWRVAQEVPGVRLHYPVEVES